MPEQAHPGDPLPLLPRELFRPAWEVFLHALPRLSQVRRPWLDAIYDRVKERRCRHPLARHCYTTSARSRPRPPGCAPSSRPALAVDRRWNLLLANTAMDVFLEGVDASLLRPPVNMMRLGLHPRGFAPRLHNLAQVRAYLLPRLARQVAQTGDAELSALYEELLSYGPADDLGPPDPVDIALPIRIRHRGAELCLINTVTTFGAAFDVTLDEIVVEAYFAADDDTVRFFRARAEGHSG